MEKTNKNCNLESNKKFDKLRFAYGVEETGPFTRSVNGGTFHTERQRRNLIHGNAKLVMNYILPPEKVGLNREMGRNGKIWYLRNVGYGTHTSNNTIKSLSVSNPGNELAS